MLSDEEKRKVVKAIFDKIGRYKCPICSNEEFSILEEFGLQQVHPLNGNVSELNIGTPYIMLICSKCGFMSKHNLISLGVLDIDKANDILAGK